MEGSEVKFQHSLLGLIVLTGVVLYISIEFKINLDNFTKNYQYLTAKINHFEDNEQRLNNTINQSVIMQHFNNDKITDIIKTNKEELTEFLRQSHELRESYPETFVLFDEYHAALPEHTEQTIRAVRLNGVIKNSISYLQNRLSELQEFDKKYQKVAANTISQLIMVKNNLNFSVKLDEKNFNYLKNFKASSDKLHKKHKFFMAHIELLYKEIPRFSKLFLEIEECKIFTTMEIMKQTIEREEAGIKQKINLELIGISVLIIFFIFSLFYFLIKNEFKNKEVITLHHKREQDLITDELTGLLNRNAFHQHREKLKSPSVIVLNIIEFKNINNILGFSGGDFILKQIGKLLKQKASRIDPDAKVFRVGSDEFAVMFESRESSFLVKFADSVLGEMEDHDFIYNDIGIPIYGLAGVSTIFPYLQTAQLAIEHSKKSNFEKITLYTKEMNKEEQIGKNIEMIKRVKTALNENRIVSFFQPIVSLETKEPVKYESLVRLIENGQEISPYQFLGITKKFKLYNKITQTVLKNSIEFVKTINTPVSINLSFEDINHHKTREYIYDFLEKCLDGNQITFELLENENIKSYEVLHDFIKKIRSYGCQLAIDDFGSGYSNYEYLLKFKPDLLKIDGTLIKNIDKDESSRLIVKSLVAFAKEANMKTVAEFVHSEEIDKIITEIGIDYGQGYYYSPPKSFS